MRFTDQKAAMRSMTKSLNLTAVQNLRVPFKALQEQLLAAIRLGRLPRP